MSFTGLKHITYKEAILSIHMGLSNTEKCTSHSMTDLLKSYRMGFGKTRSAQRQSFFFCIGKNIEAYYLF
jgi:hypothetical protein